MAASNPWYRRLASGAILLVVGACGDSGSGASGGQDSGASDAQAELDAGTSTESGPLPANTAGKACAEKADCAPGTCAQVLTGGSVAQLLSSATGINFASSSSGGYCTSDCVEDTDCGQGGMCFASPGVLSSLLGGASGQIGGELTLSGECRQACTADADCRDGYECAKSSDALRTLAAGIPVLGAMLVPGMSCQGIPTPDQLMPGQVGKPCEKTADCGGGFCDPPPGSGGAGMISIPGLTTTGIPGFEAPTYPGGYCTGVCVQDSDCPTGAVCLPGFYGSAGSCRASCSEDGDCARLSEGYVCQPGLTDANKKVCRYRAPDAGMPEAGMPDASASDAGAPEAGASDAEAPEAGVQAEDAGDPDAGAQDGSTQQDASQSTT